MHYGQDYFSIDGSMPTITTKPPGIPIGQRLGLSDLDIIKVRLLYQCTSGPRSYSDYMDNPCTSDCKCWLDAFGCGTNHDACQGELICSENQCLEYFSHGGAVPCMVR